MYAVIVVVVFAFLIYWTPMIVAGARHTHNSGGVFLVNLFFGVTIIGWIVALLLALCGKTTEQVHSRR